MSRAVVDDDFEIELRLLLEAIYLKYHHDFRRYALSSMRRRIVRAMERFGCSTLSAFQGRVLREPDVFGSLLSSLTVPVSEMFRDPPFFRALRERVAPFLSTYPSLKLWVAGCSTGEEVYSLAILLREEGLLERTIIYATDIDPRALESAQAGLYDIDRIAHFSRAYLESGGRASLSDYYVAGEDHVAFDRTLRKDVVFSDHSLATDGVFAEVQLVTCRNVLIYFGRELQGRALGLFKDSLCPNGFLGLGAKETPRFSEYAGDFAPFCSHERIFQRR